MELMPTLVGVIFGLTLTLGSLGWGLALTRLASPGVSAWPAQLPLAAGLGILGLTVLGMALNLVGLYSPTAFLAVGGGGIGLLIWLARGATRPLGRLDMWAALPLAITWIVFVVIPPAININDDTPAYLVFAKKLAETGSTGAEYFSERRLFTFGGQFALQAPFADQPYLRLIGIVEPGLGLAVLTWLIATLPASKWLRRLLAAFVSVAVVGCSVVGANYLGNTVPTLLPASFVACAIMAGFAWRDAPKRAPTLLVLALVFAAGALLFRPTPLPFAALFGLWLLSHCVRRQQTATFALACGIAALVIAPFMLAQYLNSGTPFYPFLGSGVHLQIEGAALVSESRFAGISMPDAREIVTLLFAVSPAILVGLGQTQSQKSAALILAIAALATGIIAVGVDGVDLHRYAFAVLFGSAVGAAGHAIVASRETPALRISRKLVAVTGALAVGLAGGAAFWRGEAVAGVVARALDKRISQPVWSPTFGEDCATAQAAIPAGDKVLSLGFFCASTFDFSRNEIYVHDQLGGAWVDPQLTHSSTAIAASLIGANVRWILMPADMTPWRAGTAQGALLAATDPSAPEGWLDTLKVRERLMGAALSNLVDHQQPTFRNQTIAVYSVRKLCEDPALAESCR